MSLSIDGIWKTGVWATTVWAAGVWSEGAAPAAEVVKTGTGGIDPRGRRRSIVKPLGTLHLPEKPQPQPERTLVDERVDEAATAQAEISSRLAREFGTESAELAVQQAKSDVDAEIIALLRKKIRTEDEEMMLLMLAAAATIATAATV